MSAHVGDVVEVVESAFPSAWAEPWDNVGLVAGDPYTPVTGVFVTLDPTVAAIDRAVELGCNVVATHHPAHLTETKRFVPSAPFDVAFTALSRGVALIAAHTNLDRAPGAGAALAEAAGLNAIGPLEQSTQQVEVVTTFAPPEAAETIRKAMASAGAGRIGEYSDCSFTTAGNGRFTPGDSAHPAAGVAGESTRVDEEKVEVVAPHGQGAAVAGAARAAHPYEEPLVIVTESRIARGAARMGAVCDLEAPEHLRDLVRRVSSALSCKPRVWGDPWLEVTRVACATGSGGSLIPDAHNVGAQVLLAGEIRYHDASAAMASGLAIIEAGHDVTEWPLVPLLADAIRAAEPFDHGNVHVDRPSRGWWTP